MVRKPPRWNLFARIRWLERRLDRLEAWEKRYSSLARHPHGPRVPDAHRRRFEQPKGK